MTITIFKNKKSTSFFKPSIKLSRLVMCLIFIIFLSCGNDDDSSGVDCNNGLWVQSVQTELNAWTAAAQAFAEDPTPANCQTYKSTGQDYIDALDRVRECVPSNSLSDFETALEEATDQINALSCE